MDGNEARKSGKTSGQGKSKPTRHRFGGWICNLSSHNNSGLGRFLFDLGGFGMSAASTKFSICLIFYTNLFTFNIA